MFVISDKIDKEMCPTYETLAEEKPDDVVPKDTTSTTSEPVETDYKKGVYECKCTISLVRSILVCVLCFLAVWAGTHYIFATRNVASRNAASSMNPHSLAMASINESKAIVEAIRQENALMAEKNKQAATDYLNGIQDGLKKRVEYSVKKISKIILDKVQDAENELAVFERSLSTLVDGIVDVTKHSIADIKLSVNNVTNSNDTSGLGDAIKKVENEIVQQMIDFDLMFTNQGGHINDVIYHKAQNMTDRIRMILVADRKLFRNVGWQHVAFCYNISKQNYDISNHLEIVLDVINKLRRAVDTVNVISSVFVGNENKQVYPSIVEDEYALAAALNDTKAAFNAMMNTDDNFLGTTLKELAYKKHIEMRDFIYKSYETAIMSVLPAVEKVTRNFEVVKDSHWQQITEGIHSELADLSKLIQTKAALITDDLRQKSTIVKDSEFKSVYTMMTEKFQSISSRVNTLLQTKQGYMIEGLSLTLVANMDEQLPLVATWSLRNYIPSDACPMSVEFQTYLKGTMSQYLSRSTNLKVIPDILEQAFELDAEFEYADDEVEDEHESEGVNDNQLSTGMFEGDATDVGGFIGTVMDIINSVLGSTGLTLDGPVEVYIDEGGKKKRK